MFQAHIKRSSATKVFFRVQQTLFILIIVCFIFLGSKRMGPGIIEWFHLPQLEWFFVCLLILALGTSFIMYIIRLRMNGFGYIGLESDKIKLSVNANESLFPLSEVSGVEILEGKIPFERNNFNPNYQISFKHNNLKYTCKFISESSKHKEEINKVLYSWAENGQIFNFEKTEVSKN